MSEHKIVYQNQKIKVIEVGDNYFVDEEFPGVYVLPYTLAESGYPEMLGVMEKINPLLISSIPEDTDIYVTAKRGLEEQTGFFEDNPEKWDFLGIIKASEGEQGKTAFSVNISGLIASENENNENLKHFNLVKVSQVLDSENAILHSLFLKTFQFKKINDNLK